MQLGVQLGVASVNLGGDIGVVEVEPSPSLLLLQPTSLPLSRFLSLYTRGMLGAAVLLHDEGRDACTAGS